MVEVIVCMKVVDLWFLFFLGIGINWLLFKSGEILDYWCHWIDLFLGIDDWYDEFYCVEVMSIFFGIDEE